MYLHQQTKEFQNLFRNYWKQPVKEIITHNINIRHRNINRKINIYINNGIGKNIKAIIQQYKK